jgi:glycosyltransferase involved in cell wall biosynthesis
VKIDARAIVVLGMHRGGTSVLAKAVQALGVAIGDRFLASNEWNARGYFEHPDIVRLNESLLGLTGKRWSSLAVPPWEEWQALTERHQDRALEILERDFGEARVFAIKDPRLSRLLPFWRSVFKRAALDDSYVVALRNPVSVARSLAARDAFPTEKSYLLWATHLVAAIRDTQGCPRIVVDYDTLLANPPKELKRIASFLDMPVTTAVRKSLSEYSETFLSDSLRHSVHDRAELESDPRAGELVAKTYQVLRKLAEDRVRTAEAKSAFAREWRALERALQEAAPMVRYLDACEDRIEILTEAAGAPRARSQEAAAVDTPTAIGDTTETASAAVPDTRTRTVVQPGSSAPRVSVVIPLYNHEAYIETALSSVFEQTIRPVEIVIVDDGSTDGSAEKVRRRCADRADVIFWSRPNQGAHHALNAAIHRATGDFVAVLNSDDEYDPERLAACLDAVQTDPAVDVVATEVSFIDGRGRAVASSWYEEALAFYKESRDLALALCRGNFFMSSSNLFARRAVFESVGYFSPLRYAHDLEFFLRLILAKRTIRVLERRLLAYRFHAGNTIAESQAATDVERAAVLALFVHRQGLAEGGKRQKDSRLQRLVEATSGQGIAGIVEYFLAAFEGGHAQASLTGPDAVAAELRSVLSRLGADLSGAERGDSQLAAFVAARNRLLREAGAVSKGLTEHAAEVDRLHHVLADKDRGLQEQAAEIRRMNDAVLAKDAALNAQAGEIHRLNDSLAGKDAALGAQTAEIHRLNDSLAGKDAALGAQTAEIHRLNDLVADKDSASAEQGAEIHRLNAVLVTKNEAVEEQATEIHRLSATVTAKGQAVSAQATEIHRLNEVLTAKDEAVSAQATEIHRLHEVLEVKEKATVGLAAELHRLSELLPSKELALIQRSGEIQRLNAALGERDRIANEHRARIQRLEAEVDADQRAIAQSISRVETLQASLTDKERELASWRQTSWYKLGQAWQESGWSAYKFGRVSYHLMRGVTPESLKRPVRPIVARVKRRLQQSRHPATASVTPPVEGVASAVARPRVLHVIGNFMLGGSSRLVVDLIDGLSEKYEQKVATSFLPSPPVYDGVDVSEFRSPQSPDAVLPFLRAYDPALVHVHYWGDCDFWWYDIFFRAIRELGCHVIENVNTPIQPYEADFVDRYVYVSGYVRSTFGIENGVRNLTIYPGSDFTLFTRRQNDELPPDCIGMVYRLENDKLNEQSIDPFIKVVQRRPQTTAIIVGGGTLLEPYRRAVRTAGVEKSFVFTGYVDYSSLPGYYEKMTVFVAPVWKESFGQVSSFAMSMGIPIAGYNVGGLAEIVDSPSLLAEAGNSDELATLVIRLLDDPERCRRVAARSRERAHALFSVEAMVEAYRRVYGELLGAAG